MQNFCYLCTRFCIFMKKTGFILLVTAAWLLSGCQALEKKQQAGAVVELNGNYLYLSTLDEMTIGLSSEDSARIAQQYIDQWAKDLLMYNNAKAQATPEIEAMVEDFRRVLYMHAYEEYLIDTRMPKTIADSTAEQIYTRMPNRFQLDESILKGMLVVVPNDAPNIPKLRQWLAKESLDDIEKYVYQNASGYELFSDKWLTTTDIISRMPVARKDLENRIKTKNQIELSDTLKTYLLQITDKHLNGEKMPLDYARPEIEKILLSARQVEFLQEERERMYNEAIENGQIKFYR